MVKPFIPKRNCGNCSAWTRNQPLQPGGTCRANPPTVVGLGVRQGTNGAVIPIVDRFFPGTTDMDYCRDGWQQRLPEDLPELDISRIAVDAIEGTA